MDCPAQSHDTQLVIHGLRSAGSVRIVDCASVVSNCNGSLKLDWLF